MSVFYPATDVATLLDESGGAIFFTLQQIYDAINCVVMELTAMGRWAPVSTPITLYAGTDLLTLPSSTLMIPQFIVVSGKKYFFSTQQRLEQYDRVWRGAKPAQPTEFVLWDINTIRLFPRPDISYSATLWGVPYPAVEISSGSLGMDLPPLLQEALDYRVVSEMLEFTRPELADQYMAKSEEYFRDFKHQLARRNPHNIHRLRPASLFQVGQSGNIKAGDRANQPTNNLPW
jgi:hypothetical protein